MSTTLWAPWLVLAAYAVLIWIMTPRATSAAQFFGGGSARGVPPGAWLLGVSAAMSWVMAKSVYNAMDLSASYGVIGGIAYGSYWLSFIVVGVAVYFMRTRGGHTSLPQFLRSKYGATAAKIFMIVIAIRLFNEVWSNTKVTSQFFGPEGSSSYWTAAIVMTAFTAYYSLRGGLRSSILTDAMQTFMLAVLLVATLAVLIPGFAEHGFPTVTNGGVTPTMQAGGLTFLALALVQCLSYGFHDPVLTDRAFLSRPASMMRAFVIAAILGGLLIVLFSLAGVYALAAGVPDDAPVAVAVPAALGLWMALLFNAVMLTSAGSTLDSTFSSSAKFVARDWPHRTGDCTEAQVRRGRWAMALIAMLGNLPLLSLYIKGVGPAVIAATTISGTAIMGLAPIFLLAWLPRVGPWSFYFAIWPGLAIGVLKAVDVFSDITVFPSFVDIGTGAYAEDLGINVWGLAICTAGFLCGTVLESRRSVAARPAAMMAGGR
ncbi:MAG: Na+/proline symporter [Salinisphaera sp.]|uniref:Na+/proline symporter n=1 Tax=Salinisphaera sp. TaxID=1914330 RepID=UPI003C7B5260